MLWRSPINVVALPINVMAFPIHEMAPSLAVAPGHGPVTLGAKEVARGRHTGKPQGQRRSLCPKRHLAMAWRRRQA